GPWTVLSETRRRAGREFSSLGDLANPVPRPGRCLGVIRAQSQARPFPTGTPLPHEATSPMLGRERRRKAWPCSWVRLQWPREGSVGSRLLAGDARSKGLLPVRQQPFALLFAAGQAAMSRRRDTSLLPSPKEESKAL